ncbi:MAG: LytR family transcriptional regulator [Ruminococcaceae bacterium]|nr:LytR family transcriptional regulator [Oscillospiraceae bacterium]
MKKRLFCLLVCICLLFVGTVPTFALENDSVRRFLIFGCDESGALTDTILLVARNGKTGKTGVLQIPRDTYAAYTTGNYRKLNGALRALGDGDCKAFFSHAFGVPIHWFASLNLKCVPAIVDAVGGVDLEVPMDMDYSDPAQNLEIHLQKGMQHLDGKAALSFIRYRSGYVTADLGRMQAQQNFLRAFAEKCGQLSSATFMKLFLIAAPYMKTDLPIHEAIALSQGLGKTGVEDLSFESIPGEAVKGKSGAWYFVLSRNGTLAAVNRILMPVLPVVDGNFDPDRVFDRPQNAAFHKIYSSP